MTIQTFRTGELAREAGVNVETLRFYERRGLLPEPPRRESGYREYPPEAVGRIRFIKRAQELGFSLQEIKDLLALRVQPGTTCTQVRQRAKEKVADVQQKITDLEALHRALKKIVSTCSGRGPINECPILEYLDKEEL